MASYSKGIAATNLQTFKIKCSFSERAGVPEKWRRFLVEGRAAMEKTTSNSTSLYQGRLR